MPTDQDQIGDSAGELTESEKRIAEERTALRAAVIHEAIRTEGEAELLRPASALMWSGMAAGLSMGFSLAAMGLLYSRLPDTQWRPLITDLGYTVGFLVVILGRQHLYTENTLTVMLPLLTNRDRKTFWAVLRLWSVVLVANVLGAGMVAGFPADSGNGHHIVNRSATVVRLLEIGTRTSEEIAHYSDIDMIYREDARGEGYFTADGRRLE